MAELRAPYLATGVATGVMLPFIAPLLASRGFSPEGIGLLLAISSLSIVFIAPLWGRLADVVLGRRRTVQLAVLLAAGASLLVGAPVALPVMGLALASWYLLQTIFSTLLDSMAMGTLGADRHRYGQLRLLESLSYAIAAFTAGVAYDRLGYRAAAFVFVVVAIGLAALFGIVRDTPAAPRGAVGPATRDAKPGEDGAVATAAAPARGVRAVPRTAGRAVGASHHAAGALTAILLASVGLLAASTFLPLRLDDLGAAPSIVALSATASATFEIPVMLSGGRLVEGFGLRGLFALGCVMYLVAIMSWVVVNDPMLLVASRMLTGLGYGAFTVSSVVAIGVQWPETLQGSGQAFRQSAVSAVAVLGYLFGGFVYGALGHAAFFAMAACGPVLGAAMAWRWLPARGRAAIPSSIRATL